MPKRKREDDAEEVFGRFREELHHALKMAKGFERQRQSKRLHDSKTTPDKKTRIEKEIVVLKSLDLHQVAHAHLCSALLRIKSAAESPKLPEQIKAGVPKPELTEEEKTALHNVTSGLSNRQEVRSVIEKAIPGICKVLGVAAPDKKGKGKTPDKKSAADSKPSAKEKAGTKAPEIGKKKRKPAQEDSEDSDSDEDSDVDEEERAISQLDDLLASTSGEESEEEEGEEAAGARGKAKRSGGKGEISKGETAKTLTSKSIPKELDPMEVTTDEDDNAEDYDEEYDLDSVEITDEGSEVEDIPDSDADSDSDSDSDSDAEADSDSTEWNGFSDIASVHSPANSDVESDFESSSEATRSPPPKKQKNKTKQPEQHAAVTGTTFLPSLMGGYISGSDEEASDLEIAPQTHKNRRGQRARQAIWEKRFKDQAKHLKKQQQQNKQRDSGWDPKRGAVEGDGSRKPWKQGIRNPLSGNGGNAGEQGSTPGGQHPHSSSNPKKEAAPPPPPRKRDDTGPLHPSWEAKRKAKEAQRASAPFQGKKIVFD